MAHALMALMAHALTAHELAAHALTAHALLPSTCPPRSLRRAVHIRMTEQQRRRQQQANVPGNLVDTVGDGVPDSLGVDTFGDGIADTFIPLDAPFAEQRGAILALLSTPLAEAASLLATLLLLVTFSLDGQQPAMPVEQAEYAASLFLCLEFGARWLGAGLRPEYLLTPLMLFDMINVLAVLPLLLPNSLPADLEILGVLRLLRAARILRFSRLLSRERFAPIARLLGASESEAAEEAARAVARVGFSAVSIVCIAAGLTWQAERATNPHLATYADALYFSVTTLSTVGFGDITPVTQLGRSAVVLQMVAAVTIIPFEITKLVQASSVAAPPPSATAAGEDEPQVVQGDATGRDGVAEVACGACGLSGHAPDAVFCRRCGTRLAIVQ